MSGINFTERIKTSKRLVSGLDRPQQRELFMLLPSTRKSVYVKLSFKGQLPPSTFKEGVEMITVESCSSSNNKESKNHYSVARQRVDVTD